MAASADDMKALFLSASVSTLVHFFVGKAPNFYGLPAERPTEDAPLKQLLPIPLYMAPWDRSDEETARRNRIHRNFTENMSVDLTALWAAFVLVTLQALGNSRVAAPSSGQAEARALTVLFGTYVAGRLLWFVTAARGLQPWRTITFTVAMSSALGAACLGVAAAARTDFKALFG